MQMVYTPYTSYQDLLDGVKQGDVDVIFPVYSNLWNL